MSAKFVVALVAAICTACAGGAGRASLRAASTASATVPSSDSEPAEEAAPALTGDARPAIEAQQRAPTAPEHEEVIGSGERINTEAGRIGGRETSGEVVLNFDATDIKEVVRAVLADILGVNYVIDPAVSGSITLHTSRPIAADAVLPVLESVLNLSEVAIVRTGDVYMVVPAAKARANARGPYLPGAAHKGYQFLIIPLHYVPAADLLGILEQTVAPKGSVIADTRRNLLIVTASEAALENIRQTVNLFDVDQMQGMSVGVYRLTMTDAKTVLRELEEILGLGREGPLSGMVRLMTIDRLNAILVVTAQAGYLTTVRDWIDRLDRSDRGGGRSLYVYQVENGKAEDLAPLLQQMFGSGRAVALKGSGPKSPSPTRAAERPDAAAEVNAADGGLSSGEVRIIADAANNALLIMATREDYTRIEAALRQIDLPPLQVLVEATIAEISLTDDLSFGLQWFFRNSVGGDKSGAGRLFSLPVTPSFSYTITDNEGIVRALLSTLAAQSKLNVLSAPSLLVLDNRSAVIKVGDQVPIRTSETTSLATSGDDALITSTIQYRDTGVTLEVTPRVNESGMIVLEITQDVNDVDATTSSGIDSPTIIQRQINTSVAVQSGETVVLGGLIRDNRSRSKSGVPGLHRVPVLGWLFGSRARTSTRTELLVLIKPTSVPDTAAARAATAEMRTKMSNLELP